MSEFLTKEQANDLQGNNWKLIDTESGVAWFGANFEEGWIWQVLEALSLEDAEPLSRSAEGVDFLVVAYRPTKIDMETN